MPMRRPSYRRRAAASVETSAGTSATARRLCRQGTGAATGAPSMASLSIQPGRGAEPGRRVRLPQIDRGRRASSADLPRYGRAHHATTIPTSSALERGLRWPYRREIQHDLPGSHLGALNPRTPRSCDHDRRKPLEIHGVAGSAERARSASLNSWIQVGLRPEYYEPLSARLLGRRAPAHRHRPRPRARSRAYSSFATRPVSALDVSVQAQITQPAAGPPGPARPHRSCSSPTISPWSSTSPTALL